VFVHSLWSSSPLPVGQARDAVRTVLPEFEVSGTDSFSLTRFEQAEDADFDNVWRTPASSVATHRVVVYVLDQLRLPVVAPSSPGSIIGAVSDLPALNSVIMDQLQSAIGSRPMLPNLNRNRVANFTVYEARIVSGDGERSITYADPSVATSRFLDDWPVDASLTAATIRHDPSVLLTAFSDGQIWLQGATPEEIPNVIENTVSFLWIGG